MTYRFNMNSGFYCLAYSLKAAIEQGEYDNADTLHYLKEIKNTYSANLEYFQKNKDFAYINSEMQPELAHLFFVEDFRDRIKRLTFVEAAEVLRPLLHLMIPENRESMERELLKLASKMNLSHAFCREEDGSYAFESDMRVALQFMRELKRGAYGYYLEETEMRIVPNFIRKSAEMDIEQEPVSVPDLSPAKIPNFSFIPPTNPIHYTTSLLLHRFGFLIDGMKNKPLIESEPMADDIARISAGLRYFKEIIESNSPISCMPIPVEELVIAAYHPLNMKGMNPGAYTQPELDRLFFKSGIKAALTEDSDKGFKERYIIEVLSGLCEEREVLLVDIIKAILQTGVQDPVEIIQRVSEDVESNPEFQSLNEKLEFLMRKIHPKYYNDKLRQVASELKCDSKGYWECPLTREHMYNSETCRLWDLVYPFMLSAYGFFMLNEKNRTEEAAVVLKALDDFRERHMPDFPMEEIQFIGFNTPILKVIHKNMECLPLSEKEYKMLTQLYFMPWHMDILCGKFMPKHSLFYSPKPALCLNPFSNLHPNRDFAAFRPALIFQGLPKALLPKAEDEKRDEKNDNPDERVANLRQSPPSNRKFG